MQETPSTPTEKPNRKPKQPKAPKLAVQGKEYRNAKGQFLVGHPAHPAVDGARARRDLNADTIREMHAAFREGGREAINKVMKNSPAIFLKLLVLLVPRDIEVTHKGGVKAMSDEQIERAIEVIEDMLARRDAGEHAQVIEAADGVQTGGTKGAGG